MLTKAFVTAAAAGLLAASAAHAGDHMDKTAEHTDTTSASAATTVNPTTTTSTWSTTTPALSADILGDWREEVVLRTADSTALRVYSTPIPSDYGFVTLMQDPQYRAAIAWQNTAYNQPPHTGFFLGAGMKAPPKRNIVPVGG